MPIDPVNARIAVWFGLMKGTLIGGTATALGLEFWQSLVIAAISGGIGFLGSISAAIIAGREAKKNRSVLHDVKRKLGAANREHDRKEVNDG